MEVRLELSRQHPQMRILVIGAGGVGIAVDGG
jgi:shikimate 5-dehydrogenase